MYQAPHHSVKLKDKSNIHISSISSRRSFDRIAQLVARSSHNLEVPCSDLMHDISKHFFLINGDIRLAIEFHTCFFSSKLFFFQIEVNWTSLIFFTIILTRC